MPYGIFCFDEVDQAQVARRHAFHRSAIADENVDANPDPDPLGNEVGQFGLEDFPGPHLRFLLTRAAASTRESRNLRRALPPTQPCTRKICPVPDPALSCGEYSVAASSW